jgi:hypothetical protein
MQTQNERELHRHGVADHFGKSGSSRHTSEAEEIGKEL